ncbi:hypothetical protein QNO07_18870 [Streptomyces sp. 549]|uniref:hypothetical protein n=1 Tax=Streptomyces sp. 549 TaxID=3049076 RepID=UPI0024C3F95C|nr:hypothetical protein [Streptomyces sp. 549]MDK1475456.1 hypothetical protein [Streptomyces sp. 549]
MAMFTGREHPVPGWRGGDGNAAYLDKTIRFTDIETRLNENVSAAHIFYLLARGAVVSFLVFFLGMLAGLLVLLVGGVAAFSVWTFIVGIGSIGAFWLAVLLAREPEPIAEWRVLLAEREGRRDQAYLGIRKVLQARRFPVGVNEEQGRLVLRERGYVAYISVFTYGSSLYLGWMMWRTRRGHQLIGQFLGDVWQSLKGQNQIEHQILRSEGARALREAVHLAAREGLMVALEDAQQERVSVQKDQTPGPGGADGVTGTLGGIPGQPGQLGYPPPPAFPAAPATEPMPTMPAAPPPPQHPAPGSGPGSGPGPVSGGGWPGEHQGRSF